MNAQDFWNIMTSAQVSTALVLIAGALVFIALKLYEPKTSSRNSRAVSR